MIVTKAMLANIDTNFDQFDSIGLRVVGKDYADYNAMVGDTLEQSSVWEDGDYTEDKLTGVSAISATAISEMSERGGYFGDRVLVIGSNNCERGEDAGEIIMSSAVVLAVIDLA
jgi:hypothetical protein